ncbi:hypothetical protein [Bifidobacterium scardovii]|uniref:Uncharacterized protein n=2 Tax=Bifidobacterium scardovii TaxID=158787 RepID=A0A087DGM4_9BIFI|nr:hypothetical protein [Bifidobacterium scardovii]DAE55488.1 MAG TPA: ReqiPepy6 protein [Caudoviricetes sp.]KFI94674.1 hypothetical protein BSCA_0726 [Bifidobacterium scardovii]MDK6349812.1 hypothetical protein [Bifidobacterium scardovii]MDU8982516.1 hypothetical protein [Bifidobacterium scardovii]BAQ32094.1 hypothetical phage protein [Bifidobacterium scardovii JCM 12489 = DSM 13734]
MEQITLHAYNGLTGQHIGRLPYTALSAQDSISDEGSMSATIPDCKQLRLIPDLDPYLHDWGTIYAAHMGERILHAGYLTSHSLNDTRDELNLTIGGGFTILNKRKVLNIALRDSWRDGEVLIDEDHPPKAWRLTATGTYRDLIRALIAETMKWGDLPFVLPDVEGGTAHERNWDGWQFTSTWDEISDIADLEDGPEIRADPLIDTEGRLRFQVRVGTPEIIDQPYWTWNRLAPGQRAILDATDCDGGGLTGQHYMVGGRSDDKTLVAKADGHELTDHGWPLLQSSDSSHSTVTVLKTLQSYARAAILLGDTDQSTHGLRVGLEHDVHVGDHARLRVTHSNPDTNERDLLLDETIDLKITDVKWDAASEWLTLQTRPIKESA